MSGARRCGPAQVEGGAAEEVGDLLTVAEAAALLTVSRRTVFAWIAGGRLRAVRLGARTTRVPASEVARLIREAGE